MRSMWIIVQPSLTFPPLTPLAIDQLVKLGKAIDVPVFEMGTDTSPVEIARRGVEEAKRLGVDAVIVDTAGRLQVPWGGGGRKGAWKCRDGFARLVFRNIHPSSSPFVGRLMAT